MGLSGRAPGWCVVLYVQPGMVGVSKRSGCTHLLLQRPPVVSAGACVNIRFPSEHHIWKQKACSNQHVKKFQGGDTLISN